MAAKKRAKGRKGAKGANGIQDVIERLSSVVDRGADSAERVHREIAGIPFEIWARTNLLQESATEMKAAQDRTLESIYEFVREMNHRMTRLTSSIAEFRFERSGPRKAAPRKKRAAAKKPRKAPARKKATAPKAVPMAAPEDDAAAA
jgi:hypothetical protein